jgi:hypothetical protein
VNCEEPETLEVVLNFCKTMIMLLNASLCVLSHMGIVLTISIR